MGGNFLVVHRPKKITENTAISLVFSFFLNCRVPSAENCKGTREGYSTLDEIKRKAKIVAFERYQPYREQLYTPRSSEGNFKNVV